MNMHATLSTRLLKLGPAALVPAVALTALLASSLARADDRRSDTYNDRREMTPPSPPPQPPAPSASPSPNRFSPPPSIPSASQRPSGVPFEQRQGWRPNREPGDNASPRPPRGDWHGPRPNRDGNGPRPGGNWTGHKPGDGRPGSFPHRPDLGNRPPHNHTPGDWAGRPPGDRPHHHYRPRPMPTLPYYYGPYWSGYYYWYGDYYFWGGYSYSPFRDYFFWDRNNYWGYDDRDESDYREYYFFPPNPPPLGAPPPKVVANNSSKNAPDELVAFVNEPFYALLGTRLARGFVPKDVRADIETYRGDKQRETDLLNAKLAETSRLAPAERKAALSAFANEQTPRLAALALRAENIRERLQPKGLARLFVSSYNWLDQREWTLSSTEVKRLSQEEISGLQFQTMRAFAYYQEGLSPSLRRFLREAAMDLQLQAFAGKTEETEDEDETVVFFSPELAQVRLTSGMPEAIASKFAAYADERRALRNELVDVLVRIDGASAAKRLETVKRVSESLAPRLAALEERAEELRAEVASKPTLFEPHFDYQIPAELRQKLEAYAADKQALRTRVTDEYVRLLAGAKEGRFRLSVSSIGYSGTSSLAIIMSPRLGSTDASVKARQEQVLAFNIQTRAQSRAIEERRNALKQELESFFIKNLAAAKGNLPDEVLEDFEDYSRMADSWALYAPYRTALFEQGLSLEQRRLLFDSGLATLRLPLPAAE